MSMQRRSTAFAVFAVAGLVLIHLAHSRTRHTFGHPEWVDWAVFLQLCLLGCTHVFIALVMWAQRHKWLPTEASMFRWITVKAMLWSYLAISYGFAGRGVSMELAYLYVLMAITTIDMDVKMFGRYILGWEATDAWNGETERRNGEPGRRSVDSQRGMR